MDYYTLVCHKPLLCSPRQKVHDLLLFFISMMLLWLCVPYICRFQHIYESHIKNIAFCLCTLTVYKWDGSFIKLASPQESNDSAFLLKILYCTRLKTIIVFLAHQHTQTKNSTILLIVSIYRGQHQLRRLVAVALRWVRFYWHGIQSINHAKFDTCI